LTTRLPYLTYEDVRCRARKFLGEFNPDGDLPIDIERIADVKMGLNIVPFPNLWRDWQLSGFLLRDRSEIWVDEYQADQFPQKYRFTLAHELGHYFLHDNFLEQVPYASLEEYIAWRMSIRADDIGWMETHANWFAGLVLVPGDALERVCRDTVAKYTEMFREMGEIPSDVWAFLSNEISDFFEVNPLVVERSIDKEGIPERVTIPHAENSKPGPSQ